MPLAKLAQQHDTTVAAQAKKLGYAVPASLYIRYHRGWTVEEALFTPKGETPERVLQKRRDALAETQKKAQRKRVAAKRRRARRERKRAILVNGEYLTPTEALKHIDLTRQAAYRRIRNGWSRQDAFTTPPTR